MLMSSSFQFDLVQIVYQHKMIGIGLSQDLLYLIIILIKKIL